jgi:hypothetical protein
VRKGISFRYLAAMYSFEHVGFSTWTKLIVVLYAQNVYLRMWLTCYSSNVTYNHVHAHVFLFVTEDSEKTATES